MFQNVAVKTVMGKYHLNITFTLKSPFSVLHMKIMKPIFPTLRIVRNKWDNQQEISKK